jgi:hypothetical protein
MTDRSHSDATGWNGLWFPAESDRRPLNCSVERGAVVSLRAPPCSTPSSPTHQAPPLPSSLLPPLLCLPCPALPAGRNPTAKKDEIATLQAVTSWRHNRQQPGRTVVPSETDAECAVGVSQTIASCLPADSSPCLHLRVALCVVSVSRRRTAPPAMAALHATSL